MNHNCKLVPVHHVTLNRVSAAQKMNLMGYIFNLFILRNIFDKIKSRAIKGVAIRASCGLAVQCNCMIEKKLKSGARRAKTSEVKKHVFTSARREHETLFTKQALGLCHALST